MENRLNKAYSSIYLFQWLSMHFVKVKIVQIRSFFWSEYRKYRPEKTPYLDNFHAFLRCLITANDLYIIPLCVCNVGCSFYSIMLRNIWFEKVWIEKNFDVTFIFVLVVTMTIVAYIQKLAEKQTGMSK